MERNYRWERRSPVQKIRLFILRVRTANALDDQRRPSRLFGNLSILLDYEPARGGVFFEAAEQLGRNATI
jgi:hypothetical protein